ncbi:serine/threonine-protein kinase DCLK1-like isoform X2 [Mizuhopecten yessoensis]|uniref:non-specific serine/threonine protein kinase n=1 Tax=Mizuhopecten yessoensis TaxID=6573 RepID=A0A210QQR8_MIZYE|nr:serine/threonine-protein kinase DCLK1-like isoform X2 [Mizuhopecten yessoensis]OWF51087.1 Serine/threonine-protein kinase DCLK3 [Mizuhopecten yessoensis]
MTTSMSRRVFNLAPPAISQTHKDIVDTKMKDLRRPRKIRFYVNGDGYFKGKKLNITPHRYSTFNDLLNDLTGKLPSSVNLPYGVRQIYTPSGGRRVTEIEGLADGQIYVLAGFEAFKPQVRYGQQVLEPWSMEVGRRNLNARPHNHDIEGDGAMYGHGSYRGGRSYGAFQPGPYLQKSTGHRRYPGAFGTANKGSYLQNADSGQVKPKVITIVRNGARPRNNIKILLNRRSVQSFEQLMLDVSEAFGPKYRNNKMEKLYTIRGREVQGISDFFRDENVFVAVGIEKLSGGDLIDIIEEIDFPDAHTARMIIKDLEKQKRKWLAENDKRDSGFGEGSDGSNRDLEGNDYIIYKGRPVEKGRRRHDYPKNDALANRLEKDKDKAAHEERDRAKRRQQHRMEAERRTMDDERRKRGLVPKGTDEQVKRSKEQRDRDKDDLRRKKEEERQKRLEEEERERQKHEQDRDRALEAARERRAAAEKAEKEKAEKERAEREKADKEKEKNREKDGKSEKDDKEGGDKEVQRKKKSKSKIVRKTKYERQVSGDSHILSKYDLGKTLGDGNFAIVKQATLKNTKNEFAMKIIDKAKLKGKEHMVENEIEIMKDCQHPNIVKLYEEYETIDKIYLVMELVKGGDLFDAITQSVKFGEVDSAHMVKDLCNALFYLHSRSIVHRDLKPENLLVHRNKDSTITLKLADFGLAMDVKDPIYTVCGTPTYVAPEILSEIGYGLEVDMWAVGVICYILLCGFPPFRSADRNQTELFEFIKAGEYEFLSPYWDQISRGAKDLIEHLLIVEKKKRFTAIDTLSHPWIMYNGDMGKITDNAELEKLKTKTRNELEALAKTSYDSYMKVKERRG